MNLSNILTCELVAEWSKRKDATIFGHSLQEVVDMVKEWEAKKWREQYEVKRRIDYYQNCGYVEPILCGNKSWHEPLKPFEEDGKIKLRCPHCLYVLDELPEEMSEVVYGFTDFHSFQMHIYRMGRVVR